MKVKKKPVEPAEIDAYQLHTANWCTPWSWPPWLQVAWTKEKYEEGSLWMSDEHMCLVINEKHQIVEKDDWIIRNEYEEIFAVKPDVFYSAYEAAE